MTSSMARWVARLALAPSLVVALALLAKGYADVGDGFTAGAVAALGVLLQYVAYGSAYVERRLPVRHAVPVAVAGLLVALAVSFQPVLRGEPILTHSPPPGTEAVHVGTLDLVTAVLFDVGVFLLVLGAVGTIIGSLVDPDEEAP